MGRAEPRHGDHPLSDIAKSWCLRFHGELQGDGPTTLHQSDLAALAKVAQFPGASCKEEDYEISVEVCWPKRQQVSPFDFLRTLMRAIWGKHTIRFIKVGCEVFENTGQSTATVIVSRLRPYK